MKRKHTFPIIAIVFALISCNPQTSPDQNSETNDAGTTTAVNYEIIDTHAHILLPGEELSLNPNSPGSPEELQKQMQASGVSMAGIMSMVQGNNFEKMRQHNDYILKLAKDSESFFPICSVHPLDGQAALDEIRRVAQSGARAIKVHPFFQGFDVADPNVNAVVKVAGENGLAVIFDSISASDGGMVGKFIDLAIANPQTKIVLAHMAGARFHEMILFAVFAKGPFYNNNAYFDLSAIAELYADSPREEELLWTMRQIGMDQFLFASDFPVFNLKQTKEMMGKYDFTEEELRKLYHDNAIQVFGLSEE